MITLGVILAAMEHAPNIWTCLCGPHVAAMRQLVARCDPARLVWGSDFGFVLGDCLDYRLGLMDVLDLTDDQRHAFFETNPMRLLGESIDTSCSSG